MTMANSIFRPAKRDFILIFGSFLLAWLFIGSSNSAQSTSSTSSTTRSTLGSQADKNRATLLHGVKRPDLTKYGDPNDYAAYDEDDLGDLDLTNLPDRSSSQSRWTGKLPFMNNLGLREKFGKFPLLGALANVGGNGGGGGWGWSSSVHSESENMAMEEALEAAVCEVEGMGAGKKEGMSYTESVKRHPLPPAPPSTSLSDEQDLLEDDDLTTIARTTQLVAHAPGWTVFERLYLYNGSLWVVTEEEELYPSLRLMTSTGLPANSDPGNEASREPTGEELRYITPKEAEALWEDRIWEMGGMTWLFNDGQFVDHYYHFAAELLLGIWRTYSSLATDISPFGETTLPAPARAWFIRHTEQSWRDKPRFNTAILWSAFPSISMLYEDDWKDITRSTSSEKPKAYLFPKAILADRSAAFRGSACPATQRTVAEAALIGDPGRWWWEPIRRQVLRFAGASEEIIDKSLQGLGAVDPAKLLADPAYAKKLGQPIRQPEPGFKPLVTYISRQSSRRRLTAESHKELVAALEKHSKANNWELLIVEAEKLSKEEQVILAGRTTIMLGVHGNGLTHLLWMPPTPQSAVIEMFFPGGFAKDYQWTSHLLGHRHFAIQHDITATRPNEFKVDYPEGFQGESITVVGEVVAQLIDDRLALKM